MLKNKSKHNNRILEKNKEKMKKEGCLMIKWIKLFVVIIVLFSGSAAVYATSNKPVHWGFKKGKNGEQADAGEEYEQLLHQYGGFYKGSKDEKVVYLTFDNGYENGYTKKILDVLKKEKVPAAFFVTGHYLQTEPELIKRMVDEGHIIGNHSWSHPDMTKVDKERLVRELSLVADETAKISGQKQMHYLRPPRGILSERTLQLANEEGYTHVMWSLAFKDWDVDKQRGWKFAYDQIMKQIHPGAVILLHSVSKDNAGALGKAIKDLKKDGYQFKNLDYFMVKEKIKNPALFQ